MLAFYEQIPSGQAYLGPLTPGRLYSEGRAAVAAGGGAADSASGSQGSSRLRCGANGVE